MIGPLPPPAHGVAIMTQQLARLDDGTFPLVHLDTSDRRDLTNVGAIDITNVVLAVSALAGLVRLLVTSRPRLVYLPVSQSKAGFLRDGLMLLLARAFGVPSVIHAHGGGFDDFYVRSRAGWRWYMRLALSGVASIIVLAKSQRGQFEKWGSRADVVVVPNAVEDEWRSGIPSREGRRTLTVLFLGSLIGEKGFIDVLESVPKVVAACPTSQFVFAGQRAWSPADAQDVRALMDDEVVSRHVRLVGAVDPETRHDLLEGADVLVFPPRWEEGHPLVVLEAMSSGVPVVVTPSGGIRETVADGVEGIVVSPHEPSAIGEALELLLSNPESRARMGEAARRAYESRYRPEMWLERMRGVLSEASQNVSRRRVPWKSASPSEKT
jgi:glycosyltransferase involved in cell wall biosynthesis